MNGAGTGSVDPGMCIRILSHRLPKIGHCPYGRRPLWMSCGSVCFPWEGEEQGQPVLMCCSGEREGQRYVVTEDGMNLFVIAIKYKFMEC